MTKLSNIKQTNHFNSKKNFITPCNKISLKNKYFSDKFFKPKPKNKTKTIKFLNSQEKKLSKPINVIDNKNIQNVIYARPDFSYS